MKCRLAVLLAERNLTITKVSKDTGISRTTLTNLMKDNSKGIPLNTFDTLCTYLNIKPSDLFTHEPAAQKTISEPRHYNIEVWNFPLNHPKRRFSIHSFYEIFEDQTIQIENQHFLVNSRDNFNLTVYHMSTADLLAEEVRFFHVNKDTLPFKIVDFNSSLFPEPNKDLMQRTIENAFRKIVAVEKEE